MEEPDSKIGTTIPKSETQSEAPPLKKTRTTPTDTIETMEEPDSKIGTTIPKSETQSEAPPLKKTRTVSTEKCSKSAVTTKCIYHEDVTLYNGIDDVKCLGQPGNKSKKTAWARMRQGIDLLDRVVNKDSDTREKLVQTKTQLPSEQTYFPSPSRCVNIKLANQSAAAGVEQKGIMCPNCFQRCIEKFLDGSD
jgi:hypothetical protein